ncbi:hypothetical protein G9A89_011168 [Geosiphon pyriformis]|nr:hypothetical protein G9A89_011168 [Geosiphon pyriformis]
MTVLTNSVPYNQRTQWNYIEDASSIIESTKRYYFPYPPSLPITFGALYLGIPAETAYAESNFCNYINAKINCLLGRATNTGRLEEQIHQSLLGYSTATTTQAIAETLRIINTDIKYYNQHSWTKSLGEYGSLFGNLTPAASQTEGNLSTWEQPPAQNLAESAFPLTEETAILQLIGSSDKGKQPALAPGEHSNMRTPIPLNITSNIPSINWIMAYRDIAKLEKFSGKEDNAYSWIADTEKAITANGWNDNYTVQALLFFLTGTANSWYQSLAEKPTSFTEFKLTFLQYFCDPNTLIRLQNQFSIIKQKDYKAVTTYLGQFNQILCQILAIERNYYTAAQVFNQFIKGLWSSILRSKPEHIAHDCKRKIMDQNQGNPYQQPRYQQNMVLQYSIPQNQLPLYVQQVLYTQPPPQNYYQPPPMTQAIPYYQTSPYSLSRSRAINYNQGWRNPNNNQMQTNSGLSRPIPCGPAQSQPTPTGYPNQASYLSFMEDQSFDKSTPVEEGNIKQISQPSKQTKSNIPPVTITENTTLAAIFPFDIDNLNTHSLFNIKLILDSGSASSIITKQLIDQLGHQVDCAATAQIITADGNTKTPIGEIDNFPFEINGIQISTKVLVMEATQYQALVRNDWLLKANTTLDWNTQELQLTFNRQHARVPATCGHFKNQCTEEPLIEFEDTSMPPTIETYQVSWADDYQTELLPPPTWEKKGKSRAKEEPQSSSLGYVISDQRNLFYQLPRLICVDCEKKLSTMGACIGDNEEWPTATKYYCRLCKILPDEGFWNDVPGKGETCNEACQYTILINDWVRKETSIEDTWKRALNRLDGYPHDDHKIWRMASAKAEGAMPKEI